MTRFTAIAILALCLSAYAVQAKKIQAGCPAHPAGHKTKRTDTGGGDYYVTNGVIRLGVSPYGSLNVRVPDWDGTAYDGEELTGLQYTGYSIDGKFPDATAPGCPCEGWGISAKDDQGNEDAGGQTQFLGAQGSLTLVSSSSTATDVVSNTAVGSGAVKLAIEHHFRPSPATPKLFEVNVTITNVGDNPITELKYMRIMDWDVAPTQFDECVDLNMGTAGDVGGDVEGVYSRGFTFPLPVNFTDGVKDALAKLGRFFQDPVVDKVAEKVGPFDSGATWLFNFHDITEATPLVVGGSRNVILYYGAADSDSDGKSVLAAANIEAYTYGYPSVGTGCPRDGVRFIFGFGNIGGDVIIPSCADDPNCFVKNVKASCASSTASVISETGSCVSLAFNGNENCN